MTLDVSTIPSSQTDLDVVCPRCRGRLETTAEAVVCRRCTERFERLLGIPVFAPELKGSEERIQVVASAYPTATWLELVRPLFGVGRVPEDPQRAAVWAQERVQRHDQFYAMFQRRLDERWPQRPRGIACEIGCGRGDGLPALARDFEHVVGLDVSLAALVAARKLVEEHKLDNVTLVQGSAHDLPFRDGTFDYVQAINVIEHLFRPEHFFGELKRVLSPGGVFAGDSRNRFDAFFPEPHVKLMWVGFLPRRWMAGYVKLRKNRGYTGTHLLSYWQLRRSLRRAFGSHCAIVLPEVRAYTPKVPRQIEQAVELCHAREGWERALLPAFPTHIALAIGGG